MLSKTAGYRLIVTGQIGVKEIERLISKLQLDKEILGETMTILMPVAGKEEATPVYAEPLANDRFLLTGNVNPDKEGWKFHGPVVRCRDGDAGGMKGWVVVAESD
jgi:hypothetical protein